MGNPHSHLSDIPGNLADFAMALAGLPYAIVSRGGAITNRLIAGPSPLGCGGGQPYIEQCRDGSIVRHHYSVCCVPRSYRCGGSCT
jgi:hypothetical protein